MELAESQKKVLELAGQVGPEVYLVGGFVRDWLLGRESTDIDIAIPGEPAFALQMARHLANQAQKELKNYRASPFSLDPENGTARVVFSAKDEKAAKSFYLDITVLEGGNIITDLARRDFTVNALALALNSFVAADGKVGVEDVIDKVGGLADLVNRIIRPVGEQNLMADPLRMLRGLRQRAQLSSKAAQWQFAPGTLELFKKHSALIKRSAVERVRDELNKIWRAENSSYSLHLLNQTEMLKQIVPELSSFEKDSSQFNTFELVSKFFAFQERLITSLPDEQGNSPLEGVIASSSPAQIIKHWPAMLGELEANGRERVVLLCWATLFRYSYLKKIPPFEQVEPSQYQPDYFEALALQAREIMLRLRFSREASERVISMLRGQARIRELNKLFDPINSGGISNRLAYRFLQDTHPVQTETLILALAEVGTRAEKNLAGQNWQTQLALTDFLARKYLGSQEERIIGKPRLLDGQQLIAGLGLKPGPKIGQLLHELEEAQADGQIASPEEALELAKSLLTLSPQALS